MKSHTKLMGPHQANGRILRGVLATFGYSADASAPCARPVKRLGFSLSASAAALIVLMLPAAPAAGAISQRAFKEVFGSAAKPTFIQGTGLAVDQSTGDLLVTDRGGHAVSRFKPNGEPDPFSALGVNVIDGKGSGGCATVPTDCDQTPQNSLNFAAADEDQIAVDNSGGATDGNIYVTQYSNHLIDIFASDGHYLGQLSKAGTTDFDQPCGIAVDPSGAVYVGDYASNQIHKFVPATNPPLSADNTASFAFDGPCYLAAGVGPTGGSLFAAQWHGPVSKIDSSTGVLQYVVDAGPSRMISLDPGTGHVLVGRKTVTSFEALELKEYDASGASLKSVGSLSFPQGGGIEGIAVDKASGDLFLSRSDTSNLDVFGSPLAAPPQLEGEWSTVVGFTEATLMARFGPEEEETTYHVEYSTTTDFTECGQPANPSCHRTSEAAVGPNATISTSLSGLQPGTTYHWRVVASIGSSATEGQGRTFATHAPRSAPNIDCPNQAFRGGPSATLPDCRAYELVSPVNKNGGDIVNNAETLNRHSAYIQSSTDGEKITYSAAPAFGDEPGNLYYNQYIATRREGEGWSNHGINAPQGTKIFAVSGGGTSFNNAFQAFSPDLCSAWLNDYNATPLTTDAQEGYANLYRRENCGQEGFEALTTAEPTALAPSGFFREAYPGPVQGFSSDLSRVFFTANAALSPEAATMPGGTQLYERSDGELHLVSVLPAGTADPAGARVGGGAFGNLEHAVSVDGSRVYWTSSPSLADTGEIYLREHPEQGIVAGECSEASKACTVAVSSGSASFWSANPDGSRALYSEGEDLYLFDLAKAKTAEPPQLIDEHIIGVLGTSEDLSRIYFVSSEAHPGANAEGDVAEVGRPNLYLDEAGTIVFVGTLATVDIGGAVGGANPPYDVTSPIPGFRPVRVSPDGHRVVFNSMAPLTHFDNTDTVKAGKADVEVYTYEAGGELDCVSCNPSGVRPNGAELPQPYKYPRFSSSTNVWAAGWIPTVENPLHASNVLSADGSRLFFHSYEALVPQDTNGVMDVYEWEQADSKKECEELGAALYSQPNGGCISLISSGESPFESEFWDASPDGRNVFFTTESKLLPQDPGLIDLYDARVDGGFAQPNQPAACEGEACQPPPAAPNDPTPASSAFEGAGNVVEAPTKKKNHKKRRKGKHHRRANYNRRAAR